nr:MAG TPA: hypothetical protein [Crassvirales sp.]DAU27425.1 MAG TPA: hypothetical protein [Crassvirales sp.]
MLEKLLLYDNQQLRFVKVLVIVLRTKFIDYPKWE